MPKHADTVPATRGMLRGALTAVTRINEALVNAALLHAGTDLVAADDALESADFLVTKLAKLIENARISLSNELQQQPEDVAA